MTAKHFGAYKETIIRCIESCTNTMQLACCWDMLQRFGDIFTYRLPVKNTDKAVDEIITAYEIKESILSII